MIPEVPYPPSIATSGINLLDRFECLVIRHGSSLSRVGAFDKSGTVQEAVDLGAQLPLIVRGLYFEGWRPHKVPHKIRAKDEFLDELSKDVLPYTYPVDWAVKTVLAHLADHCDPGEIADVIGQLPEDLKELWPERARAERSRVGGGTNVGSDHVVQEPKAAPHARR